MGNNMNYKAFNFEKIADKLGSIVGGEDNEAEAFVTRTGDGETAESSPFFGTKNVLEGLRVYVTFRF